MPKVSIIVPIYNVDKYLKQCLDSCINQTLQDIEIICVNDGSTDNCLEIINEYALKDSRIKVINQDNQGLSMARNNGFEIATGEYILFVDSDDWLAPQCCELTYNQAKENNNDFVYFNHAEYLEKTNKIIIYNQLKPLKKIINQKQVDIKKTKNINYITRSNIWNKLYKRSWLAENKLKFIKIKVEDTPYMVMSFLKSNSISFIEKPLYIYRIRTDSLVSHIKIEDFIEAKTLPIKYLTNSSNAGNLLKVYLNNYFNSITHWYYTLPLNKEEKTLYKIIIISLFTEIGSYDKKAYFYIFLLKHDFYLHRKYLLKIFSILCKIPLYITKSIKKHYWISLYNKRHKTNSRLVLNQLVLGKTYIQ